MKCPACQKDISDQNAVFCPYCGVRLHIKDDLDLELLQMDISETEEDAPAEAIAIPTKHRKKRHIGKIFLLLFILALLVVGGTFGYRYWKSNPVGLSGIDMPEVVGMTTSQAEEILNENNISYTIQEEYTTDTVSNIIVRQQPEAGTRWSEKEQAVLTVQKTGVVIPDVTDMYPGAAVIELKKYGFNTKKENVIDDEIEKNHVIRTEPPAGTISDTDTMVTIFISEGGYITIPDVIGEDYTEISDSLKLLNLDLSTSFVSDESHKHNEIIKMDPEPGTVVVPRTKVTVYLSVGKKVELPSVENLTYAEVVQVLENIGLKTKETSRYSSTVAEGNVISVDQNSSSLYEGDTVTIVVSQGPDTRPDIPSLTGKTESEAKQILNNLGITDIKVKYKGGDIDDSNGNKVTYQSLKGKTEDKSITLTINSVPISVEKVGFGVNSAGGVDVEITFKNLTDKTINYIDVDMYYYNRVGDPAYCTIKNTYNMNLQYTGPLKAGSTDKGYWDATIYNSSTGCLYPKKYTITFSDGEKVTITSRHYWFYSNYSGDAPRD